MEGIQGAADPGSAPRPALGSQGASPPQTRVRPTFRPPPGSPRAPGAAAACSAQTPSSGGKGPCTAAWESAEKGKTRAMVRSRHLCGGSGRGEQAPADGRTQGSSTQPVSPSGDKPPRTQFCQHTLQLKANRPASCGRELCSAVAGNSRRPAASQICLPLNKRHHPEQTAAVATETGEQGWPDGPREREVEWQSRAADKQPGWEAGPRTHVGLLQDVLQLVGLSSGQRGAHVAQVDRVVHHPLARLHHLQHRLSAGTEHAVAAAAGPAAALAPMSLPLQRRSRSGMLTESRVRAGGASRPRAMRLTTPCRTQAPSGHGVTPA